MQEDLRPFQVFLILLFVLDATEINESNFALHQSTLSVHHNEKANRKVTQRSVNIEKKILLYPINSIQTLSSWLKHIWLQ